MDCGLRETDPFGSQRSRSHRNSGNSDCMKALVYAGCCEIDQSNSIRTCLKGLTCNRPKVQYYGAGSPYARLPVTEVPSERTTSQKQSMGLPPYRHRQRDQSCVVLDNMKPVQKSVQRVRKAKALGNQRRSGLGSVTAKQTLATSFPAQRSQADGCGDVTEVMACKPKQANGPDDLSLTVGRFMAYWSDTKPESTERLRRNRLWASYP